MGKMLLNGVEYVGGRNTGGASALEDLTDVNVSSITDGQILKYDSTTSKWVNDDESGGTVTDVQVNGTTVVDSNKVAQITSYKELTRAEYDLLPDTKYSDGIMYCISDGFNNPNGFPPLIYSTEEREVGVWIDGKPLYQKTCKIGSMVKDSSWHSVNHNIANIDNIVNSFGMLWDTASSGVRYPINVYRPGNTYGVVVQCNRTNFNYINNWLDNVADSYITVQYTKTTDTAGSGKWATDGGLAKHYSTQEQIIGTWIDGKPLYEKTVSFVTSSSATDQQQVLNVLNTDNYFVKNAYVISSGSYSTPMQGYKTSVNSDEFCGTVGNISGVGLRLEYRVGSNNYNASGSITVQYTKTTD